MEEPKMTLEQYLGRMMELRASDLFLDVGKAPSFRVDGKIVREALAAPTVEAMNGYLRQVLTPLALERFEASPDIDVAYTLEERARFRINFFFHQGKLGLVARLVPLGNVEFAQLTLPPVLLEMAQQQNGLILVVGPTGCGKSTTLASLVHQINRTRSAHVVTIEDPIEFLHKPDKCLIHQRQVGYDTQSFAMALKHVVRQSPDVILIGEMRDTDTMQTAMSAALTGHLILSTLHTTNVVQSIDRILNFFPAEARGQAQADLAATLIGIISMRLLPRKGGSGRVPAVEVLRSTPTVRRAITEGQFVEIYDVMKRDNDLGMQTLTQSLVGLCQRGLVSEADAMPHAPNPDEFRLNMAGMFTGIDSIDLRTGDPREALKKKAGEDELR